MQLCRTCVLFTPTHLRHISYSFPKHDLSLHCAPFTVPRALQHGLGCCRQVTAATFSTSGFWSAACAGRLGGCISVQVLQLKAMQQHSHVLLPHQIVWLRNTSISHSLTRWTGEAICHDCLSGIAHCTSSQVVHSPHIHWQFTMHTVCMHGDHMIHLCVPSAWFSYHSHYGSRNSCTVCLWPRVTTLISGLVLNPCIAFTCWLCWQLGGY